jgi:hypothetical protein
VVEGRRRRAAGVRRVVAIFGVQGWRWAWTRDVRELVFALDADAAGQQAWRALARQAALRGKRVAALPREAYGGCKDVSAAWGAGVLTIEIGATGAAPAPAESMEPVDLQEAWEERTAIMVYDGHLPHSEAAELAWAALVPHSDTR